jgi:hypothetical protein
MKTLANPTDQREIVQRMLLIEPGRQRQWGKMTVGQMVCHLSDAFRVVIGEREVKQVGNLFERSVFKWAGLWLPAQWPHGISTVAECDPERGGTPAAELDNDLKELRRLLERFATEPRSFQWQPHPIFGPMSDAEWMRWGYLHMDHHLRQFGI